MNNQLSIIDEPEKKLWQNAVIRIFPIALEIVAAIIMVFLVIIILGGNVEEKIAKTTAVICFGVVIWSAGNSISSILKNIENQRRENALREIYVQMDALNRELRAQRHDFLNHIQVIYSLIELNENKEAIDYIEQVYENMQRVSKSLRIDNPAVNALLESKAVLADQKGIEFTVIIGSKWQDNGMPVLEICRIMGNLIDNAFDASLIMRNNSDLISPRVELMTGEDVNGWFFSIRNNGKKIKPELIKHIFDAGFSTKGAGHGMGLYIVNKIVNELGGQLSMNSDENWTVFSVRIPRVPLKLPESTENM